METTYAKGRRTQSEMYRKKRKKQVTRVERGQFSLPYRPTIPSWRNEKRTH